MGVKRSGTPSHCCLFGRFAPRRHALRAAAGCAPAITPCLAVKDALRPRCAAATRSLTASLLGRDRSQANGQAGKAPARPPRWGYAFARLAL